MPVPPHLTKPETRFCHVADEWLVLYAHLSDTNLATVPMAAAAAMSLELYLKAYFTALTGNHEKAITFGHRIADLANELQTIDPGHFPPVLRINPDLAGEAVHHLDGSNWTATWYLALSDAERLEFDSRYEVYLVAAAAKNLKYGISPPPSRDRDFLLTASWSHLNPVWADIAIAVRQRIDFPRRREDDRIWWAIRNPCLSDASRKFLIRVVEETTNTAGGAPSVTVSGK